MEMPGLLEAGLYLPALTSVGPGHELYPQLSGCEAELVFIKPKFTVPSSI